MSDLAETILRDVPRHSLIDSPYGPYMGRLPDGAWLSRDEVLAALSAALDGVDERAERLARSDDPKVMLYHGEYVEALRALLAQNAALRAERDALAAQVAEVTSDRAYIIGANAGWEAAVEQDVATPAAAAMLARADAAEAKVEKLRGELQNATEAKLDAISTLDAWFDRRKLGHDAVDQAVVDAASGYLRTSRVGGMPQAESDLILGVMRDMARLGLFADLFARAALTTEEGHE